MSLKDIPLQKGIPAHKSVEIAIIGGGVSGLYAAYRLTHDARRPVPAEQVQVFEMSDRIGGRLESVILPGMEIAGELGGMRYISSQEIVRALIEDVFANELTHIPFPMGDDGHHFGYFRKQRMRMNAWEAAQEKGEKFASRYHLNPGDEGYSADQLFNKVVYEVLTADPWFMKNFGNLVSNPAPYQYEFRISREQWNMIKPNLTYQFEGPYKGMKVNNMGFWNLIKDRVSQEGFTFLSDTGGYYSNTINWNAAEAFLCMTGDFTTVESEYRTIDGGYDLLAYSLANAYLQQKGANIWTENRLETFSEQEEGNYKYQLKFVNHKTHQSWTLNANKIVLAMPRRSLELLDQSNFFFQPGSHVNLKHNMGAVIIEPSLKILMGFEYPWWKQDFGVEAGHSITDLPIRQCYYFGTDPNDNHSIFLGSYNDMRTVTFWQVLAGPDDQGQQRPLFRPRSTNLVELSAYGTELASAQATQVMVDEVMAQVRELHGKEDIPEPYVTWYKDWSEDPYGGGYHAWKANYDVEQVMPFMRRPDPNHEIFICGEAWSDQQGWVEGAFCVTERMLQDHFGLTRPDWIPADYYLGW